MKNMTRLIACLLVLATLIVVLPVTASAATVNCGSGGSQWERTYKVRHTLGTAVKLARHTIGAVENELGIEADAYGTYSYTVQNSKGKVIKTGTWKADKNASVTLVGALAATGTYTITVSKVKINTATHPGFTRWAEYPRYKLTF